MEHADQDNLREAQLLFLLGMSFQLVLDRFVSKLDAAGYEDLRPIHGLVFQALLRGETTSTEIAATLGVTKQATGQIINDLVELGYVYRTDHPEGGRRRMVALTEKGYAHLETAGRVLSELESEIAAQLPQHSTEELHQMLVRIIRQLAGDALPAFRPIWH